MLDQLIMLTLAVLRLAVFALSLGLTLISFQAYRSRPNSQRLESAFIGFAFLSMGVALTALRTNIAEWNLVFQIVETIPFIIGFGMLYVSLYR